MNSWPFLFLVFSILLAHYKSLFPLGIPEATLKI